MNTYSLDPLDSLLTCLLSADSSLFDLGNQSSQLLFIVDIASLYFDEGFNIHYTIGLRQPVLQVASNFPDAPFQILTDLGVNIQKFQFPLGFIHQKLWTVHKMHHLVQFTRTPLQTRTVIYESIRYYIMLKLTACVKGSSVQVLAESVNVSAHADQFSNILPHVYEILGILFLLKQVLQELQSVVLFTPSRSSQVHLRRSYSYH